MRGLLALDLSGPEEIGSILDTYTLTRHTVTRGYASKVVTNALWRQSLQVPACR
jgi:hypothetical protein